MLDVALIRIGADCQIATGVHIVTATHPVDPEPRRLGWESAEPIRSATTSGWAAGPSSAPALRSAMTPSSARAESSRATCPRVLSLSASRKVQREIAEADRIAFPLAVDP